MTKYILIRFILFTFLQISIRYCVEDRSFLISYFDAKRVSNIVGFTCNETDQTKLVTTKMFNSYKQNIKLVNLEPKSITVLNYLKKANRNLGIFLDKKCMDSKVLGQLYTESNRLFLFTQMYKWLIISTDLSKAVQRLNDSSFSICTDLTIAVLKKNEYVLYEAYNPCKYRNGRLFINEIGKWKEGVFVGVTFFDKNFTRRFNLEGLVVKTAGYNDFRPANVNVLEYMLDTRDKTKDSFTKFAIVLLLQINQMFNFTLDIKDYTTWGDTGMLSPAVVGLFNQSIDISGNAVLMIEPRMVYVNYVFPMWPFRTFFIFRTTSTSHVYMGEFLRPFHKSCWYLTGFLLVTAMSVFIVTLVFEDITVRRIDILGQGFLMAVGSLSQQGSAYIPTKSPGRIAFLYIMLFSLLIFNYYSASVVSSRLSKPIDKINDSLVELLKTKVGLGAEKFAFFGPLINQSEWEVSQFRQVWESIPESERIIPKEEGLKRVEKGGYAYHTRPESSYTTIERTFDNQKICELTEVQLRGSPYLYLATAKESPFEEITRLGAIKLAETGVWKRLLSKWIPRKLKCRKDILSSASIKINEVVPCFVLLLSGIFLSVMAFLIELIVHGSFRMQTFSTYLRNKK